jgi:predicted CXXCH cytochrome family protein
MTEKLKRLASNWRLYVILIVLLGGMVFLLSTAGTAYAVDSPDQPPGQMDGEIDLAPQTQAGVADCLACHSLPNQFLTFPDGEKISVTITLDEYNLSIHGAMGFDCQTCHKDITGFPHPEVQAQSLREFVVNREDICIDCHPAQYSQLKDSIHYTVLSEGNINAPVCSDCHNPHARSVLGQNPLQMEMAVTSEICASCHNSIYVEYAQSVHGKALFQQDNPDVPGCTDCHGTHDIADPTTAMARLTSPELCAKCHSNHAIMDKYGLSTDVLSTYLSDFHGKSVFVSEKLDPNQPVPEPVCYDCHGAHRTMETSNPLFNIQAKENLLSVCQKCHPDASINFPSAWLSHYIPSPSHFPLVYYVQRFYQVFVPTVIGGMALFVATDWGRRIWNNARSKQKKKHEDEDQKDNDEK